MADFRLHNRSQSLEGNPNYFYIPLDNSFSHQIKVLVGKLNLVIGENSSWFTFGHTHLIPVNSSG